MKRLFETLKNKFGNLFKKKDEDTIEWGEHVQRFKNIVNHKVNIPEEDRMRFVQELREEQQEDEFDAMCFSRLSPEAKKKIVEIVKKDQKRAELEYMSMMTVEDVLYDIRKRNGKDKINKIINSLKDKH